MDVHVAGVLDHASESKEPIFKEKLDREIAKFLRTLATKEVRDAKRKAERDLQNADRHFRRSANQLLKCLSSLN